MPAAFHRLVIPSPDGPAAAQFVARLLDLARPTADRVCVAGRVDVDFAAAPTTGHCVFLVDEDEFDLVYGRTLDLRTRIWADPARTRPAQINHDNAGRGIYIEGPGGLLIGIVTR